MHLVEFLLGTFNQLNLLPTDAPQEMPHFSDPRLVKHFAYKESLGFAYFLKQGRPSFAFCAFIYEQLQTGNLRLSHKK